MTISSTILCISPAMLSQATETTSIIFFVFAALHSLIAARIIETIAIPSSTSIKMACNLIAYFNATCWNDQDKHITVFVLSHGRGEFSSGIFSIFKHNISPLGSDSVAICLLLILTVTNLNHMRQAQNEQQMPLRQNIATVKKILRFFDVVLFFATSFFQIKIILSPEFLSSY